MRQIGKWIRWEHSTESAQVGWHVLTYHHRVFTGHVGTLVLGGVREREEDVVCVLCYRCILWPE